MDLVDLARRPFADVAPAISGSVVYMDEGAGECAHHCAGAGFILSLGAVNVLSLNASRAPRGGHAPGGRRGVARRSANAGRDLHDATAAEVQGRPASMRRLAPRRRERHGVLRGIGGGARRGGARGGHGERRPARRAGVGAILRATRSRSQTRSLRHHVRRARRIGAAGDEVPEENGANAKETRRGADDDDGWGDDAGGDGWGDDWGETEIEKSEEDENSESGRTMLDDRARALRRPCTCDTSRCPSPRCREARSSCPPREPPRPPPSRPPPPTAAPARTLDRCLRRRPPPTTAATRTERTRRSLPASPSSPTSCARWGRTWA